MTPSTLGITPVTLEALKVERKLPHFHPLPLIPNLLTIIFLQRESASCSSPKMFTTNSLKGHDSYRVFWPFLNRINDLDSTTSSNALSTYLLHLSREITLDPLQSLSYKNFHLEYYLTMNGRFFRQASIKRTRPSRDKYFLFRVDSFSSLDSTTWTLEYQPIEDPGIRGRSLLYIPFYEWETMPHLH